MGRPRNDSYGVVTKLPNGHFLISPQGDIDPDTDPDFRIMPDYFCWGENQPGFPTDDPAPPELESFQTPLAEFGWSLTRQDNKPLKLDRLKTSDIFYMISEHPGSNYKELLLFADGVSPAGLYAHLMRLVKTGEIIKKYREDGERVYFTTEIIRRPTIHKFLWLIRAPEIFIDTTKGQGQPMITRLRRLRMQFAPYGWVIKMRDASKKYISWENMTRITDLDIISLLENEPGATVERLAGLYLPPNTIWTPDESAHAISNMKVNLYRLTRAGRVTRDGVGYHKTLTK